MRWNRSIAQRTVAQADLDAGSVVNVATGTGTGPVPPDGGEPPLVEDPSNEVTVPAVPVQAITLTKIGTFNDADGDGLASAGETITYTFTVTNTGNVTLTDVVVVDPRLPALSCSAATMAPGDSFTCTGDYVLTEQDITNDKVPNTATATGTAPNGSQVETSASVTVDLPTKPLADTGAHVGQATLVGLLLLRGGMLLFLVGKRRTASRPDA